MTNEEFITYAAQHIHDYLPPEFKSEPVRTVRMIRPNDEKYTGLVLMRSGAFTGPNIPLEPYAEMHRQGRGLPDVMREIAAHIAGYREPAAMPGPPSLEFSSVRDRLTSKLCDPAICSEYLQDKPWTQVGDWGLLYRIRMMDEGGMVGSAPITFAMLEQWGISAEDLHREAVASESSRDPAWMSPIQELFRHDPKGSSPNLLETGLKRPPSAEDIYVLSNASRFNGACVVGWDGVLESVADVLGGSFYVIPTSIHEVLIVPDRPQRRPDELEQALRDGNADPRVVAREDILSDRVQFYDHGRRRLGSPQRRS